MIISDLKSIVRQKNRVSFVRSTDKWHAMEYRTADFSGVLLTAEENTFPTSLNLKLDVTGYYNIWLGFIHLGVGNDNHITVRLGGDKVPSNLCPEQFNRFVVDGYNYWAPYQWMEEGFWKCADLTGQDLIIEKPDCITGGCTSTLAFIRLEKAEKNRDTAHLPKNMMFHCDTDHLFWYYRYKTPEEYASVIDLLSGGTGEIVVQETYFEDFEVLGTKGVEAKLCRVNYSENYLKYLGRQDSVAENLVNHAHAAGMKIYAGTRLEMGNFMQPLDTPILSKKFVEEHPEFAIYTRDGRRTPILSYAYKEVREWEINRLMKSVERGYDGISVFFIRGVFIGFERPVLDRFISWYGEGVDPRLLPIKEERLSKVMCSFITEFFEELKDRLVNFEKAGGRKIGVNIVVNYDIGSNKFIGCDIEALLKKGLVDSVSQGLMKTYEDLTDCMDGDLIDMEKYESELAKRAIVRRTFHDKAETVLSGAKELLALTSKYNADFYGALPWESKNVEYFVELAQKQYDSGVKKLIVWNANHITESLPKLNVVKNLGDFEKTIGLPLNNRELRSIFRVMSLDGKDISTVNTSWLG